MFLHLLTFLIPSHFSETVASCPKFTPYTIRVCTSNTYFLQRCFIYTIDVDGLFLIPADELAPLLFHLLPPLCLVMVYFVFFNAFLSLVPIVHLCFAISAWHFVLRWRLPGDKMLFSFEQHFYFGIGIASYFEDKKYYQRWS